MIQLIIIRKLVGLKYGFNFYTRELRISICDKNYEFIAIIVFKRIAIIK